MNKVAVDGVVVICQKCFNHTQHKCYDGLPDAPTVPFGCTKEQAVTDAVKSWNRRMPLPPSEQPGIQIGHMLFPMPFLAPYEPQALRNHGQQTLKRLADRGGLAWQEAADIMRGNSWNTTRDREEAKAFVLEAYQTYLRTPTSSVIYDSWQPIRTAPKDGSEVLVGVDIATVWIVRNARWVDGGGHFEEGWWTFKHSVTQEKLQGIYAPTHWMPMAEPPEVNLDDALFEGEEP